MRLKSIKLAGFKSFVDPTTVDIKSNLVAVVGPNGSGKSNIIDAVRWVMGESSAKYLRGESMTDVIFNGSSGRKPAAHASIDLMFDNTEGRLGGQYAGYNQLSIKREVTRDGQSNYYLNGTRCRRKDIKDIFLGTGLGPRSYAIIMQDTISRLIEAKPEDFRAYIEEVAGISKYKERRHETELRIKHTRENLERLSDLRQELESQLNRLDRQAKAAERYKVLKEEERTLKAQLYALQWQLFDQQLQQQQHIILEAETELEAAVAIIRRIDATYEEKRESQLAANDNVNEAQANYYKIGAEISRLEQAKQHQQERLTQINEDYQAAKENYENANEQLQQDAEALSSLTQEGEILLPKLTETKQQAEVAEEQLMVVEEALHEWQLTWDKFNEHAQQAKQTAQVEQTRIQHLQQKQQELNSQFNQLQLERQNIQIDNEDETVMLLQNDVLAAEQQQEELQQQLDEVREGIHAAREIVQQTQNQLDNKRNHLQQARGKFSSLEALQEAALRQKDGTVTQWLQQYSLNNNPRLAETLTVNGGWEKAVETVLGSFLEAVCVNDMTTITQHINELKRGNVVLIDQKISANYAIAESLAAHVEAAPAIAAVLAMVKPVTTLAEALALLPTLTAGQSVITKDGIWLGAGWVRVAHGQDNEVGVIERQKEITVLKAELELLQQTVVELEQQHASHRQSLQQLETEREDLQLQLRQISAKLAELQAALKAKQLAIKQQQDRYQALIQAIDTAKHQINNTETALNLAEVNFADANNTAETDALEREKLLSERETYRAKLDHQRQFVREYKDSSHELALRYESVTAQLNHLRQNIERNKQTVTHLTARQNELAAVLENADKPMHELQQQLEALLEKQLQSEKQLIDVRQQLAGIDFEMRELTQQRRDGELKTETLRNQLEQKRMNVENVKVRRSTMAEQLQQMDLALEAVLQAMPAEAEVNSWQSQLESVEHRINRLGPINLAAIDEFKEVSERKVYLDAQNEDLEKALQTLEAAISKIDKETRQKFKETYDKVNGYFETLFPKIFGGGSASLELTGDDLLETGITVMARPPGKKNSTIHLLSGGEKALTALALVFSLFQINPAPFCMLDEVDAPLDDVNVGRFCNLVKEMSKEIQFIFISHNKLAIEMGDHLIGVTMREPGVSRLVAVDVQEAVEMAVA